LKRERLNKKIRKCRIIREDHSYEIIHSNDLLSCGASLEEVQEEAKKALQDWDKARKSVEELETFVKVMWWHTCIFGSDDSLH
jgi:hypothetical protein